MARAIRSDFLTVLLPAKVKQEQGSSVLYVLGTQRRALTFIRRNKAREVLTPYLEEKIGKAELEPRKLENRAKKRHFPKPLRENSLINIIVEEE
jgi:hypothetical protein